MELNVVGQDATVNKNAPSYEKDEPTASQKGSLQDGSGVAEDPLQSLHVDLSWRHAARLSHVSCCAGRLAQLDVLRFHAERAVAQVCRRNAKAAIKRSAAIGILMRGHSR